MQVSLTCPLLPAVSQLVSTCESCIRLLSYTSLQTPSCPLYALLFIFTMRPQKHHRNLIFSERMSPERRGIQGSADGAPSFPDGESGVPSGARNTFHLALVAHLPQPLVLPGRASRACSSSRARSSSWSSLSQSRRLASSSSSRTRAIASTPRCSSSLSSTESPHRIVHIISRLPLVLLDQEGDAAPL